MMPTRTMKKMAIELNQIERDFIEFISRRRNRSYSEIEDFFIRAKNRFMFSRLEYRKLAETIYHLYEVLYDDRNEKGLVDAYKFHELLHLFRFISYSYPRPRPRYGDYGRALIRIIRHGDVHKVFRFLRKKLLNKQNGQSEYATIANYLVEQVPGTPVVVDYGCGLGYLSFEIGKLNRDSKIYLVDIDCLTLAFAEFRFKKYGMNVEIIPVSKTNLYPKLPKHTICIATEVMEHVMRPLTAYQNIYDRLPQGGLLYGNFNEHSQQMFHVSPDLSMLRERIYKDFHQINVLCYKKK